MKTINKTVLYIISLSFVLLFSYAAGSKLLAFENYKDQLNQSPGLEGYGNSIAFAIIALQVISLLLLCYVRFRFWGLCMTLGILTVSAAYVGSILLIDKNPPCTCIGIFEKMSWKENLQLNLALIFTALIGITLARIQEDQ